MVIKIAAFNPKYLSLYMLDRDFTNHFQLRNNPGIGALSPCNKPPTRIFSERVAFLRGIRNRMPLKFLLAYYISYNKR